MTSVLSGLASWRERQQTRRTAELVQTNDDDAGDDDEERQQQQQEEDETNSIITDDDVNDGGGEEGQFVGNTTTSTTTRRVGTTTTDDEVTEDEEDDDDDDVEDDEFIDEEIGEASSGGRSGARGSVRTVRFSTATAGGGTRGRHTLRREDLEEEREIVRRRTSACVLFSSFILLRLWIQAVVSGDFGLLLLCLVFTSWTARFIRHTREREEVLDRMINEWDDNAEDEVNDARIRRMSFQSQLALAIMQSQIQMMEGGHGHPDGGAGTPGVTDEAKDRWDKFTYQSSSGFLKAKAKSEEQKLHSDKDVSESSDEEPHCSICLGEYENGEKLVMLPCKHIYHDDCISSWCDNHTRCPLCNMDLEAVVGEEAA